MENRVATDRHLPLDPVHHPLPVRRVRFSIRNFEIFPSSPNFGTLLFCISHYGVLFERRYLFSSFPHFPTSPALTSPAAETKLQIPTVVVLGFLSRFYQFRYFTFYASLTSVVTEQSEYRVNQAQLD